MPEIRVVEIKREPGWPVAPRHRDLPASPHAGNEGGERGDRQTIFLFFTKLCRESGSHAFSPCSDSKTKKLAWRSPHAAVNRTAVT